MQMSVHIADGLVGFSHQYERYAALRNPEEFGYSHLSHGTGETSDFGHLTRRQKLLEERYSSNIDRMLPIKLVGSPFEIGDDIVRFDAIDVVDHRKVVWIWNESKANESVDMDGLAFPVSEKVDVRVSEFVGAGSQNLPVHPSGLQAVADSVKATHAAEITDLVKTFEVFDGYRSPLFCDGDIHTVGCLSGSDGLAIKDPPRASTFGGSAIMASAPDNYNGRLRFR